MQIQITVISVLGVVVNILMYFTYSGPAQTELSDYSKPSFTYYSPKDVRIALLHQSIPGLLPHQQKLAMYLF